MVDAVWLKLFVFAALLRLIRLRSRPFWPRETLHDDRRSMVQRHRRGNGTLDAVLLGACRCGLSRRESKKDGERDNQTVQ